MKRSRILPAALIGFALSFTQSSYAQSISQNVRQAIEHYKNGVPSIGSVVAIESYRGVERIKTYHGSVHVACEVHIARDAKGNVSSFTFPALSNDAAGGEGARAELQQEVYANGVEESKTGVSHTKKWFTKRPVVSEIARGETRLRAHFGMKVTGAIADADAAIEELKFFQLGSSKVLKPFATTAWRPVVERNCGHLELIARTER